MKIIKSHNYVGYNEVLADGVGLAGFADKRTGELLEAQTTTVTYPVGSIVKVQTPTQQERNQRYKSLKEKHLERGETPSFYFAASRDRCGSIKPQTLARLFFLATFLEFGKNELYRSERTMLTKSELPALMKLSPKSFYRFWSEVKGEYLLEREDGALIMCDDFFRDALTNRRKNEQEKNGYQRVFIKTLRELYWQTPTEDHIYLGYLFMVLPFINWEWNCLCENPEETDLDKVTFLTIKDFCKKIGSNSAKPKRFLEAYRNLSFVWNGERQYLCSYLEDQLRRTMRFIINPRILYRGSNPDRVLSLGMFFVADKSDNGEFLRPKENEPFDNA